MQWGQEGASLNLYPNGWAAGAAGGSAPRGAPNIAFATRAAGWGPRTGSVSASCCWLLFHPPSSSTGTTTPRWSCPLVRGS